MHFIIYICYLNTYIVFYPGKTMYSEKTLRHILRNYIIDSQMWDEDIPVPWERYSIPIEDTEFRPLAMPIKEMFGYLTEEEMGGIIETAQCVGYDAFLKD